jgi:Carboxypeptidase regulatory-like domain
MKPVSFPRIGLCVTTCIVSCLTFLSVNRAVGQQATAQLAGTIRDASHAIVVGARVTLKNPDTNITRKTTSNRDGDYLFTLVPIGTYEVSVEQHGFSKYVRKGITLEINQNAHLDVQLKVGSETQVVEVVGDLAQVDTISATLGKVETTKRILDLPLVERDTLQLGLLQAGVFAPDQDDGSNNPFSVSGQRSESMTFLIDGADNNDFLGNNIVVNPNPDAVSEFKILTNNYGAEYGRTSGGIINQVIKSGTNSVHGSLFEFFRNNALNAADFFLQEAPVFKRNLFGGSIGAPIVRDRTFFFASYQGNRRREGQVAPALTVLSGPERTGNFSELLTGSDVSACPNPSPSNPAATMFDSGQLFDPVRGSRTVKCADGTKVTVGFPYPGNLVPVDPVIAKYIANYLPMPNRPANQFISAPVARIRDDQGILRVDHTISSKDTLSGVYLIDDVDDSYPFQIVKGASTGGDVPVGSGFTDAYRYQSGSLSWTRTISPTMVNELRFAANRVASLTAVPIQRTTPASLGFRTVYPDDPAGTAAPPMTVSGAFELGPSPQGPTKVHDVTFQYQDTLSWSHGRHDLKFGGDLRWVRNNFNYDFYNNGSFSFGDFGAFTASPDGLAGGSVLADFVGGFWDNYYQFSNAVYGIRTHSLYFFGQDAYKLTKRLTLSYGLRYEYNSPQIDPRNEIIGWYPGQQSKVFPAAPVSFLYPGDPGTPNRGLIYPDRNNFAPRFGFAWDVIGNAKFVIRGGYGIFYDIEDGALNLQFGGQPPHGYVANNYPCYSFTDGCVSSKKASGFVADPFGLTGNFTPATGKTYAYPDPYPFAAGGNDGMFFSPALPFAYVVSPHFRTPYAQHFNFGFQYQVTNSTMVEAVYVGSLSRKAIATTETNYPTLAALEQQLQDAGGDASQLNPECARPLAFCDANGIPTGAQQIYTNLSGANSSSNEFQLTVDRRFSRGLTFRAAYTLSKTIDDSSGFRARTSTFTDPTNPAFDRGLADFDATHRLVLSPVWQIPFDKAFQGNPIIRKVTEGWSIAAIVSFQSGAPFTLYSNNNSSESDNFLDRPDVVGPIHIFKNPRQQRTFTLPDPNLDPVHLSCVTPNGTDPNSGASTTTGFFYFDPTNLDCANVPLFSHGNMGRSVLRGPGINNWDLSVLKDFKFTESKSLEFRAEFFNAFNHVQFYSPTLQSGTEGGSAQFGQITTDRGARILQFALKVYF